MGANETRGWLSAAILVFAPCGDGQNVMAQALGVRTQTAHQRKNFGKMGTRPCEAESSGSGSRSSCPQVPRYFSPLGRSCRALSACMGILRRSRLVVSWIRSGGEPNGYDLCTPIAELNPPFAGLGRVLP